MSPIHFNLSENSTSSNFGTITARSVIRCIPMFAVSLASFIGNAFVLGAIYRFKSLQTFSNAYIGSLAITDVVASFAMIFTYTTVLLNGEWVFGDTLCQIQGFSLTFLSSASMLTLLCFSMYRCYLVTTVSKRLSTGTLGRMVKSSVATLWILSTLYAMPPMLGRGEVKFTPYYSCIVDFTSSKYYSELLFVLLFTVPLLVMLVAYVRIIKFIRIHNRTLRKTAEKHRRRQSDLFSPSSGPNSDGVQGNRCTVMELKRKLDNLGKGENSEEERSVEVLTKEEGNKLKESENDEARNGQENENEEAILKDYSDKSLGMKTDYDSEKVQFYLPQVAQKTVFFEKSCAGESSEASSSRSKPRESLNKIPASTVSKKIAFLEKVNHEKLEEEEGNASSTSDGHLEGNSSKNLTLNSEKQPASVKTEDLSEDNELPLNDSKLRGSFTKISVSSVLQKWRTKAQNRQKMWRQYRRRVNHQARLARILMVTIIVFIICWAPLAVDSFLLGVGHTKERPKNFQLTSIWLAFTNAVCNPIIYALLNTRFRVAFKTILQELTKKILICHRRHLVSVN